MTERFHPDASTATPSQSALATAYCAYVPQALLLLLFVLLGAVSAQAQTSFVVPQQSDVAQEDAVPTQEDGLSQGTKTASSAQHANSLGSSGTQGSTNALGNSGTLPASQIVEILQQRPEVVVELKSLLADQMQQQGAHIQSDDITDEMLYNQIGTNARSAVAKL